MRYVKLVLAALCASLQFTPSVLAADVPRAPAPVVLYKTPEARSGQVSISEAISAGAGVTSTVPASHRPTAAAS